MSRDNYLFTSESVSEASDKVSDRISDAVVDLYLSADPCLGLLVRHLLPLTV